MIVKLRTICLVIPVLSVVVACSGNSTTQETLASEPSTDTSQLNSTNTESDPVSDLDMNGLNSDDQSTGAGGVGVCVQVQELAQGDKAVYKVVDSDGIEREISLEVTEWSNYQIRYLVTENNATFEARELGGCRRPSTADTADPNTNLNGYSGNLALQQILGRSRYVTNTMRMFDDLALLETNCLNFSNYEEIVGYSFQVQNCDITYQSQYFPGGTLIVSSAMSNFDIAESVWIVEQKHTFSSGDIALFIQLKEIKVDGKFGEIDTF